MTKYKCGCESKGMILMKNNIFNFIVYDEWAKSDGVFGTKELCLYCWCEKYNKKPGLHCGYKKGKWTKEE